MKRTLIVYYSRSGTARRAAELLHRFTAWPRIEVRDVRDRAGGWGDLRCAFDSLFLRSPAYELVGEDMRRVERLVVVAPIWMAQLAAPMRSYLHDYFGNGDLPVNARVSLVCVMGREGAFNAAAEVARIAGKSPFPVLPLLQNDVMDGDCQAQLQSLVHALDLLDAEPQSVRPSWLSPDAG